MFPTDITPKYYIRLYRIKLNKVTVHITFDLENNVDQDQLASNEAHSVFHPQVELVLTHLCQMEFPTILNWTSPVPF